MKKMIYIFMFTMIFTYLPLTPGYAASCEQKADVCYGKCDERFSGSTFWDGAARNACKSGCAIAEAGCIVADWIK